MESIEKKPKTTTVKVILILSLISSAFSLLTFSFAATVHYPPDLSQKLCIISFVAGIIATIFALSGIISIKRLHVSNCLVLVFGTICLGIAIICCISTMSRWSWISTRSIAVWNPGLSNMCKLASAILIYANDHEDRMPDPNHWCDVLLDQGSISPEDLCIPTWGIRWPFGKHWPLGLGNWPSKDGANITISAGSVIIWPPPRRDRCDFAMNSNCRTLPVSGETVILFESKPGWNQSGSLELASSKHSKHNGIFVYRAQEGPMFVDMKYLSDLSWKDD